MVRGKISLGRAFFSRVFPGWAGPEEVDDVVVMTSPMEGAGRFDDLSYEADSTVATAATGSSTVPGDRMYWVPYGSTFHDDAALTAHLTLAIRNRAGNDVVVSGGSDVTANRHISLRRPIIIPEGGRLIAILSTAPAAGKILVLRFYFVELNIGEYVPPL